MESKIGVLIIDDDYVGRQWMRSLVQAHEVLTLMGEASDLAGGRSLIEETRPEVIFLDIHLTGGNGFDILPHLTSLPKIVCTTSSPFHTLRAFEWEAVDYLVKPISKERFAKTVQRLQRTGDPSVAAVRHSVNDRVYLRSEGKVSVVRPEEILCLEADGNFTRVHLADGSSPLIGRMLGEYVEMLPSPPFFRLDRSLIVNFNRFLRVHRQSRNDGQLWLRDGVRPVEIGRTAMQRINEIFKEMRP